VEYKNSPAYRLVCICKPFICNLISQWQYQLWLGIKAKQLPIYKLVLMTTHEAPSMMGKNNGFLSLCINDDDFADFLHYHCIIYQQALCCKVLKRQHIMDNNNNNNNNVRSSIRNIGCLQIFSSLLGSWR
jgi:hypothetical protein